MSCKLCFVGQYRMFCLWPALRNCLRTDVALANELCFSGPLAVLRVLGLTAAEKRILALLSVSDCYDALAFACFCTARQVMSDVDFRELLPGHSAPALQTGSSLPAAPSTSWTETFAPKLDAATISALKSAFEISYPSELGGFRKAGVVHL